MKLSLLWKDDQLCHDQFFQFGRMDTLNLLTSRISSAVRPLLFVILLSRKKSIQRISGEIWQREISDQWGTAILHSCTDITSIVYNYPPKGRWIVVDIYRDAKRRGIYPPLFTDPEGDSCFSIYQIRWIKKCCFNFFFWNFRETTRHFSCRSQNSE